MFTISLRQNHLGGGSDTPDPFVGTYAETYYAMSSNITNTMTIALSDDPSLGKYLVVAFGNSAWGMPSGEYYMNLKGGTENVLTFVSEKATSANGEVTAMELTLTNSVMTLTSGGPAVENWSATKQ